MSGGAKKAIPREKVVTLAPQFYEVTTSVHFIGGRLVHPGEIIQLPVDVQPGDKLIPVDSEGNRVKVPDPKADQKK